MWSTTGVFTASESTTKKLIAFENNTSTITGMFHCEKIINGSNG
jgi:hypothetical protein